MLFKRSKTNELSEENLKKGEKLFFKYNGHFFHMDREGEYEEYRKLKIPKELEAVWRNQIFDTLTEQIAHETDIIKKTVLIGALVDAGIREQETTNLISNILEQPLDTFSRILLSEHLKSVSRYTKNMELQHRIAHILETQKRQMLSNDITVNAQYKELSYMSDYDFSDANIKNRIHALTEIR